MIKFDDIRRKLTARALEGQSVEAQRGFWARLVHLPRWIHLILGFVVFALLYWGMLGTILSDIKADLTLRPDAELLPVGGSVAVGTAAMLIDRAVNDKGWTPNNGFWRPTALLEDMPAFQRGQRDVILTFVAAMAKGGEGDPLLAEARDGLSTPPDRSWLHGEFPFIGGSAESRYNDAVDALKDYNLALADDGLERPLRGAELQRLIAAIDQSLSTEALAVDRMVDEKAPPEEGVDAKFQEARGAAYAATMLLRGLRDDYGEMLTARGLGSTFAEATETLDMLAKTDPFSIGREELVEQGYFLLRARASLRTIASGLAG